MNVYISGKITGLPIEEARHYFVEAAKHLQIQGHTPCDPMLHVPFNEDWQWSDYMKADIKLLLNCDAIFMLHNWKESRGAKIEHDLAFALEMKVMYQ
jgi:hypothetical protein